MADEGEEGAAKKWSGAPRKRKVRAVWLLACGHPSWCSLCPVLSDARRPERTVRAQEEEDVEALEVEDDEPAAKQAGKKQKGAQGAAPEGDKLICTFGSRRVTVNTYQGNVYVNIREYYEKDGKQLPGKKGIALSTEQWSELVKHIADVSAEVARRTGGA